MEESSYVPNSIPPALVVFSQAGYGDAIRMQRPFGAQVSDGKDLSLPSLSPSSFGLRPMDSYGGLPAQLVHLQNPFLHPALEARLPFGSAGAFRPVVTSTASSSTSSSSVDERMSAKSLPSAFTAPNLSNRRKLDSIVEGVIEQHQQSNRSRGVSQQQDSFVTPSSVSSAGVINLDKSTSSSNTSAGGYMNGQSRHRSCSPAQPVNCSPSSRDKGEEQQQQQRGDRSDEYPGDDRDGNGTPNSDMTDRSTPEDAHMSKRRRKVGEFTCPVCKMSLHPIDLESHLLNEVEQLICISQIRRQQQLRGEPLPCSSRDSPNAVNKKEGQMELSQDSRWDTYQRVRNNRHSRLRLKSRRRREESGGSGPSHPQVHFPVCRIQLHGSNEQLSGHLESCIRKNGEAIDEDDEPVDIEGDGDGDSHEINEYAWNGHRRMSKSSHPMTAINYTTSRRRDEENDTLEVVVDGDEASAYGYAQYTEADIQAALKSPASSISTSSRDQDFNHAKDSKCWPDEDSSNDGAKDELTGPLNDSVNLRMVIQALRTRVRELEKELNSGTPNDGNHCLVCMDRYKKPVVSISCWHVHCERCWLRSLGTKKVCPQCNMITSVSDLRRIFL